LEAAESHTLDALVPGYLALVPKDPQDGKPLRYKRRPDGLVVYWISLDRLNPLAKGIDQGFQLWDVKHRRQPATERLQGPTKMVAP
jgi:hypothetical protein